jgi:hypothetical protein
LCYLPAFMIAAQQGDSIRVSARRAVIFVAVDAKR